jgi:ATP-dependent HslUV protease ATP-binding subunit HslU
LLDDISFTATDKAGETFVIDKAYVADTVGKLAKDQDLSKFIL